ncbi:hypothetical protein [Paenibacillus whitsoniae]|uniref:Uncharacterized protein n=1 Tax=Paenibacillus whitsoniae TaxID=2496558 RepID=A0A430JAU2_9BACL|nr:hypothetical protein [Paenibacillus whitsoniae]RTE08169.1 hypothetical protein EJQ19_18950 [Paenibacillus whitsoniae]
MDISNIEAKEVASGEAVKPKRGRPPKAEALTGARAAEMRVKKETAPKLSGKPLPWTESLPVEWQELYLAVSREVSGE